MYMSNNNINKRKGNTNIITRGSSYWERPLHSHASITKKLFFATHFESEIWPYRYTSCGWLFSQDHSFPFWIVAPRSLLCYVSCYREFIYCSSLLGVLPQAATAFSFIFYGFPVLPSKGNLWVSYRYCYVWKKRYCPKRNLRHLKHTSKIY